MNHLIEALPQKAPFLFVDTIESFEYADHARGTIVFPDGHPVFDNHLPNDPIVPGVILIEAMAQLSGIVMIAPGSRAARGYLAEVRRIRFRRLCRPGERVVTHSRLERKLGSAASFEVHAEVDGEIAAEGVLVVGGME